MNRQDFVLTMVFSHWTLSKIINFLTDYLNVSHTEIGPCKIERFRDKRTGIFRDSNRTLILLKKEIFDRAVEAGLHRVQPQYDFRIDRYCYQDHQKPDVGYSEDLYLVVPKKISDKEIERALYYKIQELVRYGILQPSEYKLEIALSSRISGETEGYAMLRFADNVESSRRLTIKLLLHDCFIYLAEQDKLYHLPVFWNKKKFRTV